MSQQLYPHKDPRAHPYQTPISATNPSQEAYPTFRSHQPPTNLLTPISAAPQTTDVNMNGQSSFYSMASNAQANGQAALSPSLSGASKHQSHQHSYATERSLPSQTFSSDEAFEDAYVQFILYCNPAIPEDANTHDLRKNFASPPRSDSKTFSTKKLYDLLQQMDRKELKTWTELALKLGVEKPAIDKGQSSQKVQQYSVRLKRWLRASHIDAFFDFMMGKNHKYMDLPTHDDPFPEQRDGVYAEDDLALRALKPEFRPKRGRKRAESDEVEPMSAIEPKRPHLDTAFDSAYPQSAYPGSMSAHPDNMDRFSHESWGTPGTSTPSSAIPKSGPTTMRWRLNETPSTPHPLSAITPSTAQTPDSAFDDSSSQSQKMRMRRRHGTAVSSAWPSNSTTPNGKLRGRPPTNRSVKDGPFISFPANPNAREGPPIDISRNSISTPVEDHRSSSAPSMAHTPNSPFRVPAYPTPISATAKVPGRPERLSLQVPQHVGNPVRLVTPTVTLNGETGQQYRQPETTHTLASAFPHTSSSFTAAISNEDLKRSLAADLLKADVTGRASALRGTEAKDLAESLLANIRSRITSPLGETNEDPYKPAFASWLGLNPPANASQAWSPVSSSGVKKIHIRRFQVNAEGYDIPIEEDDANADSAEVKQTFDIDWELNLGGLSGRFQIKGLVIGGDPKRDDEMAVDDTTSEPSQPASADTWKQKYLDLQAKLKERDEHIKAMQDRVLEAVL